MIIAVGDPPIQWGRLDPQEDLKKIVLAEPGIECVVGITTEEIRLIEVNGQPALQRTQAAQSDALGNRTTISVVLCANFEPISHHDEHAGATTSLRYNGLLVSGTRRKEDGTVEPIRVTLDRPVFDAHSVEMMLRVLPLRQGYVAKLPVYHAPLGRAVWVTLQVIGQEMVDAGAGREEQAWIVETDWQHAKLTYWIGEKPPQLLKQSSVLPSGEVLQFVR